MQWLAIKALQTLMYNWRVVPGVGQGVLPSCTRDHSSICLYSMHGCLSSPPTPLL